MNGRYVDAFGDEIATAKVGLFQGVQLHDVSLQLLNQGLRLVANKHVALQISLNVGDVCHRLDVVFFNKEGVEIVHHPHQGWL